ncbi:MAG: NAD-dependent epimerase/dehydratase family protein [Flavobacteriales bacterium]|nr:NAD-dependent epimerase/dehydratase family protein [Flavobacteriia bacterium]NCP04715.1 NAD-dependent epimerase/dehydratase family protein [Flavobacteriales bacterium]PIV94362.1 MAG: NAD-dependent epimerase [Flavobacteriaceae bacterium CG17_big_fil_post_rev_8_21_14_2_50_33_15]PIY10474.1 MAG: NAD-dependent epimerase [Flavobacteriaceae bacterium CG_4_10_14_3_um_filter_33_47]PJB16643.1 MAG: NAD-dependent epimerase [Flavobacteriaceae bacterium CG_4_9_14_3_um_filter_33_16]
MILVTGGTGLVGSHLLYKLASEGEKVRAIYRNERKLSNIKNVFSCYTADYMPLYDSIEWLQADILDIPSLTRAFNNIAYVYHCAAFVSFEPDKYHLLRKTNIEGTANMVNLCIAHHVKKLCYVSSIATLGNPENLKEITEETEWNAEANNTIYAITKYGAEIEVWRGSQEGLSVVIVNPGVILGAGIWRYGSGNLFTKAYKGLKYYTAGSIGLVDVEDVVGIMIALIKSNITNERFILVAENWHYKDFLQNLAKALNVKPPEKLASVGLLQIGWRLDWLNHKLFGKRRQLTKNLATSLTQEKRYSHTKIKECIDYNFKPVSKSITEIGALFLKQVQ